MESIAASMRLRVESFAAEQSAYSLFDRSLEKEIVPVCREYGLGITPFGPLAEGWLTGSYRRGLSLSAKHKDLRKESGPDSTIYHQEVRCY